MGVWQRIFGEAATAENWEGLRAHPAGGWSHRCLPGWRMVVTVRDRRLRVSALNGLGAIRQCCLWAPEDCHSEFSALRAVLPALIDLLGDADALGAVGPRGGI